MALQLWLGGSGSGKSHRLYETIIKEAGNNPDINYLVLVPEQFTLQTQRDIVMLHPDGGIINIDVLSFNRLSYRIFEEVGFVDNNGIVIDDMGKNLILRYLAGQHRDDLKVIGRNLKRLGYITEVKSVISEFMQYGVNDDKIARLREISQLNNRRLLSEKLDDMQVIYDAFKEYIKEKYTTTEELLSRAAGAMSMSAKLRNSVVILDGYTGFTPVQYDFLREILKCAIDLHVTVLSDTSRGFDVPYDENDLFYMSYKTVRELKHIADENKIKVYDDIVISDDIPIRFSRASEIPEMLIHLEKNIFRQNNPTHNTCNVNKNEDIRVLTAVNPLDEMSYVAVLINDLIRNHGYKYKDIAIVSGDLDTYMKAAVRTLDSFNIPYFIDKKQPILLNPAIEYLRSAMRVVTEGYSFDAVFSFLKSSLTGIDVDDINELENYCLACGIKGKKRWNNKFIRHTKATDDVILARLNLVREKVISSFGFFDNCKTVRDYSEALFRLLEKDNIQVKLKNRSLSFEKAEDFLKAKEYIMIFPEIIKLLDKLVELLGDEEISPAEYSELLNAGFDELRIGIIPGKTDYVQIGDLTRSRFRDIKVLFFVGVNEGVVPKANSSGGILSDMDREFFCDKGAGVELAPTSRMQSYTQRLYLYMVMTKPSEKLFVSYCRINDAGKSSAPSYLIGELKTMFPSIRVSDYGSVPLIERVCTEKTGLKELALHMQENIKEQKIDELFEFFAQNKQYNKELVTLINSAFTDPKSVLTNSVTSKIAHAIYGGTIYGSISRLEMFAKCAYEHYLGYGLKLREREEFKFDIADMGSVFHEVLEEFSSLLNQNGETWGNVSKDNLVKYTLDAVKTATNKQAAIYDTYRSTYVVKRIERIMLKSIQTLKEHVVHGDFVPSGFEYEFYETSDLSALNFKLNDNDRLRLTGRIDRLDVYEDDNRILIKIIDYKSGSNDIDLAAIYRGEQLQLVVYMNAAMESFKEKSPNKEIVPAGILYYHICDPVVDAEMSDSEETIKDKIYSGLRMTGMVNDDREIYIHMDKDIDGKSKIIPLYDKNGVITERYSKTLTTDDFKVISDYVNMAIGDMGREMLSGKISATPGNCTYCPYKAVCKMSNLTDNEKGKMSKDEVLQKMREKIE